jgi:small-conductance mechanosensitive channel
MYLMYSFHDFIKEVKDLLNYTLFKVDHYHLKVMSLVSLFGFFLLIIVFLKLTKKIIYSVSRFDEAKKYSIYSLIKYFIIVLSLVLALQILGVNLSILVAGSAALLVGLGLGIQNLFSDYISGIIILIDSTVKVGDIIEVNGMICQVQEIQLRTTKVLTRDDKNIVLPNSDLTRHHLINWTLSSTASRFEVGVGVEYSADVQLVIKLLLEAGERIKGISKTPAPFVRLNEFSESSIDFTYYFWVDEVFRVENIRSEIRIKILELFKEHNINIPFPQRVIYTK